MRLIDLDPRWLIKDGRRVGFTFVSPTDPRWRQSCFAFPMPRADQLALFDAEHCDAGVQGCKPNFGWTIEGGIDSANFETITVQPSLDGSAGGLWHGHITNGEIR